MKIRNKRIPSAGPSITRSEIELVSEAMEIGWGSNMSMHVDLFTEEFSQYLDIKYCLPTAHCTDAIHLSMLISDIGQGDEVIVPDLSWVASAGPITYVGATPVFVDVDPINFSIDPNSFEKAITSKTKAVVAVDLLGNMPDWERITDIAKNNNLKIIEDAAEGIGAKYKGRKAGTFGDISLFSFSGTKLLTSGQGGMLCTNDKDLFEKAKILSHQGIKKEPGHEYFWSTEIGYNYNWTNIQAALALAQLRRIEELINYKKWLFEAYKDNLESIKGLTLNRNYEEVDPVYWITTAIVEEDYGLSKQDLVKKFSEYEIDIRPLFYPISSMPPYKKYFRIENKISAQLSTYGICLPSGNGLTTEDVDYVCEVFKKILKVK
jgi:perosamine synthetase